jgi:long-chain acyl-CoA synthetase
VSHQTAAEPATGAGSRSGHRTIPALWRAAVARKHLGPAYLIERDGRWEPMGWDEASRRVDDLANGLLALGVRKGDAFGILASTRVEWCLFDFALALVGGITAPVYATGSSRDCAHVLGHSEAVGILVEDETKRVLVEELRGELPRLEHLFTFADLDDLAARGRAFGAAHPTALERAIAAIEEDDLYTFIYTSGTTGPPKACMIRHRNFYAMASIVDSLGDFLSERDVLLLFLPLAHNFGRLMHLVGAYTGFTTALCPDPSRVADALIEVRPTFFPSVPRLYEKIHAALLARFDEAGWPRRAIVGWALRVGRRASAQQREGRQVPAILAVQHRLADRLVYSKIKERLGGRVRIAVSGGAPLAPEIAEFFHALDVLILEGYGQTEITSAAAVNLPERVRFGTVGQALPGFEVEVADDGELLLRSETVFAGYFKDEAATRSVLAEDGWLRTGDVARIEDGFISITDRKKDIIVTAGGKNVSPQNLENELKNARFVSQAIVIGDRRPCLAALITVDADEVSRWAALNGFEGDVAALAARPDVRALVEQAVEEVNRERAGFEQIKRFAILGRDFTQEAGEVTPTLKLKRRVCEEHFADEIERLYAGED